MAEKKLSEYDDVGSILATFKMLGLQGTPLANVNVPKAVLDTYINGLITAAGTVNHWLSGSGAPSGGTGVNGDFYFNATNGDVYGPKTGGAWGSPIANLTGPAGADGEDGVGGGTQWHVASGAPDGGAGADGDFYLDSATGNVYGPKTGGAWGTALGVILPKATTGEAQTGTSTAVLATPDSITKYVEQFGLGTSSLPLVTDLLTITRSGLYRWNAASTGGFFNGSAGVVVALVRDADTQHQLLLGAFGMMSSRDKTNGTWGNLIPLTPAIQDGGALGQVLAKMSSANYHTGWIDIDAPTQVVGTDEDFTLTPYSSSRRIRHTGTLTAPRTITLSTTNVRNGLTFRVTRTGTGAHALSVGGLIDLNPNTWCDVTYSEIDTAYYLSAYGSLAP